MKIIYKVHDNFLSCGRPFRKQVPSCLLRVKSDVPTPQMPGAKGRDQNFITACTILEGVSVILDEIRKL